ncbi:basic proline-rich protein-like [Trachypithecus francoisi]|uniref:basic proline-rich protein-like n=1 Tax=Trachypithecus francoisi TaxID=54180 RepID=UPI00141BEDA2|nr:basic proline-rich protein-like [Trachypithecus francoisi]
MLGASLCPGPLSDARGPLLRARPPSASPRPRSAGPCPSGRPRHGATLPRIRSPAGPARPWPRCGAWRAPHVALWRHSRPWAEQTAASTASTACPRGVTGHRLLAAGEGGQGRRGAAPRRAAPPPGGRRTEPQPAQVSTGHRPAGGEDEVRAPAATPARRGPLHGPDGPPAPSRRTPGPRRPRAPPAASQCVGRGSDQRPAAPPCPLPGPGEDAGSAVLPGRPRGCARYPAQGLAQNKCFGALDTHHTTPALLRLHIYVSDGNQSHKWRQIQRLSLKGDRRGRELQVAWPQDGKAAL